MANTIHSIFPFFFILNIIFLSFSWHTVAMRDIPHTNPKISDMKHPETFGSYDGTVLIPGLGRVVIPPKGTQINPFTYNPITGTNTGNGFILNPGTGIGIGIGTNIPGGDGTLFPHP
ncbi:hypothetical protein P3L10_021369 [Capsicum annuum]